MTALNTSIDYVFEALNHWADVGEQQRKEFKVFCTLHLPANLEPSVVVFAWTCFFEGWRLGFDSGYSEGQVDGARG